MNTEREKSFKICSSLTLFIIKETTTPYVRRQSGLVKWAFVRCYGDHDIKDTIGDKSGDY